MTDLRTNIAGLGLPNPILTASGCAAAGRELQQFFDVAELGAVVTKSILLDPRAGRATPRMAETASGMLNSIGLQGPGVEAFVAHDLPWLVERGARAIVSIAGGSVQDYYRLAQRLSDVPGISALEVNISCPNVEDRGHVFACHADSAASVISAVRRATDPAVPVLAKLSPDVTDIVEIATAVVDAGADGLSMINTLLGMAIDPITLRPVLAGVTGGLSGPAIRPVAVRCIWQVHAALPTVPIVGMGGCAHRPRRARARPRRRVRGIRGNRDLQRPARAGTDHARARGRADRAGIRPVRRRDRLRPPPTGRRHAC